MAARVQRFIYDNHVLDEGTVISATSQQPGNPVSFIIDPLRSKGWRSKVGWTVVAGFNDKMDFSEGGVARVGTITPGTYATGSSMGTAVAAAMNSAPGVTNTYGATYTGSLFTISRTAGAATVALLFATGANAASSPHIDLGFLHADKLAVINATSDNPTYQSRQAILVDLGSAQSIEAAAIVVPDGVEAVSVQGSSSTFVGVGAEASPTVDESMLAAGESRAVFFGAVSHRYWRLLINPTTDPLGYVEVGIFAIGSYFQPERSYLQGNVQVAEMLTTTGRGDQGAIFRNTKNTPKRLTMVYQSWPTSDKDTYVEMEDSSIGNHIFLVTDALNDPHENTYYGVLEGPAPITQSVGDGTPYPDRWRLTVVFLEDLG